jgi:hypothetical protein
VAQTFSVETSYEDVEFLGGAQTRDVLVTGIRTKPSGIYIEVRVPLAEVRQYGAQLGPDLDHPAVKRLHDQLDANEAL